MARRLHPFPRLFPLLFGIFDLQSAIYDWSAGAQPGDRTGPNPTRKAPAASRAALWC